MPTKPEQTGSRDHDVTGVGEALMHLEDLMVHFDLRGGALSRLLGGGGQQVKAVDGVNLTLR